MVSTQPGSIRPINRPARLAGRLFVLWLGLCGAVHSPAADADNDRHERRGNARAERSEQTDDIGPARAAEIARRRFGGKVLKIERRGAVYRVKLLLPDGKVKSVYIESSG